MDGWGYPLMAVGALVMWGLLVAALVVAVVLGVRALRAGTSAPAHPTPEQLLAERFARGEIDDEEYARRRRTLTGR